MTKQTLTAQQVMEIKELQLAEVKLVREMALDDLWMLINLVLWAGKVPGTELSEAEYHYDANLHVPLCEFVTSKALPGARKLILQPRQTRKSYVADIAHCVWRILRDPNIRILIISALDGTAKEIAGVIKRIFQYNEGIKKYFPEFHVPPDHKWGTEYQFTHPLRTKMDLIDPTVRASYLGAPLAGKRCDILICDDPIEKKHITTPEQADKSLHWFNDLIPLVDDNQTYNMIFVIGTRWGFNDIYGAILGESRGEEAKADLGEASNRYECIVRHCLEDANGAPDINGKPIFKRHTRDVLMQMLEDYKKDVKLGEEDWWKQMMNVCISPSGRKFLPEWFDNVWVDRLPANVVWSGIAIDSATKDEQVLMKGDYTAVLLGHFDSYGHLYLTDAIHRNDLRSPDLMNLLVNLAQRNTTFNVVKEKVGEEMFFGMVRDYFNRYNLPLSTYALNVRKEGKKFVRVVEALQQPLMAGKIHFVKNRFPTSIFNAIVDESIHLGQWSHDDLVDCLSLFYHKDIRVMPSVASAGWQVPNTRLPQIGDRVLGPSRWSNRIAANTLREDGTMRDDPFGGRINIGAEVKLAFEQGIEGKDIDFNK